jgi:membrane protein DedA with SNARE-associated domain
MGKLQRYFRRKATRRRKVVDVLQAAMEKHYFKVLLLGKLSLGMAIPSIIAAGVSKISWRKWFPTIVLGEILYTCTLVLFGYFATESISHANQTIKIIGIAATTIIVLILVIYLPHTIRKILMEEGTTLDHPVDS